MEFQADSFENFLAHELYILDYDPLVLLIGIALFFENEELIAELLVHNQDFTTDHSYELLVVRFLHCDDLAGLSCFRLDQLDRKLRFSLESFRVHHHYFVHLRHQE